MVLLFASVGWGISIWFVIVPWDLAVAGLREMGARPISDDPFLNYWMRVIGLICSLIGLGCLMVALRLDRYAVLVPLVAWFHFLVGVGSLLAAIQLRMSPTDHPTLVAEIIFSLTIGIALLRYQERVDPAK